MATIALYASRANLMSGLLKEVQQSVADYQAELFSLSAKSLTISASVCNMEDVMNYIQASTRVQEQMLGALEGLSQRNEEFIEGAAATDGKVADLVRQRWDDFYTAYPYLKPECDKSWLEWAGDKLAAAGEWCRENWKAVALMAGMIVCMVAYVAVMAVCPAAGAVIVALSKAFLLGQLIGGGFAAGLTALRGGSLTEIVESFFDGAFLGGYGALIGSALTMPLISLSLVGAMAIGGVSAGLPQTLSYGGDRFFKGEEISDKEILIGSALAGLGGAITAGILYVMCNGLNFKGKGGDAAKGHEDVLDDALKDGTGAVDDGLKGGSKSKIGDFTNLEGSTVDDILDRIPDEATLRELYPVEGGATEGFEFKWVQDGQTYRVRIHNADPGAPVGSNAADGWILRIQRGTQYYDYTINEFQPARFTNPNGPFFDESIMNNTHIPILDPYAK